MNGIRHWLAVALGAILAAIGLLSLRPASAQKINVDDLRPGLVATYRDPGRAPVTIVQLEPTIALALQVTEAAHPRLSAAGGTVRWKGYVHIARPGPYRFSALLRGTFRLSVDGKEVFDHEVKATAPERREGPAVSLAAGFRPISAEFTRLPGIARLEVFWQGPQFHAEPLTPNFVFHLPAEVPPELASDRQSERGRFLAEELNCTACHQPADSDRVARTLTSRQGPDLSQIGRHAYPGWLLRWLQSPRSVYPEAIMPRLFGEDEVGKAESYAVARYLASLGGPLVPGAPKAADRSSIRRGEVVYGTVGCAACHGLAGAPAPKSGRPETSTHLHPLLQGTFPLTGLPGKTMPVQLAAYLADPLALDPSGRMPNMLLSGKEALDLAAYLCAPAPAAGHQLPAEPGKHVMLTAFKRVDARPDSLAEFQQLRADKQWLDLGKRIVIEKGCNNCHKIEPDGQPFANVLARASFDEIKEPARHNRGCLVGAGGKRGDAPDFELSAADRQALVRFLTQGTSGAGSPSSTHAARVSLQRYRCLACHSRDGDGGLSMDVIETLKQHTQADADAVLPPPLTGIGHKLRTPWLRQVLTEAGRARPWLALRMPQFGKDHVGKLPEALAALEGTVPDDTVHRLVLPPARVEAGQLLIGKVGFNCVSCHDLAGTPSTGTRGPDLATISQRVRYDWYRRWLEQAPRMLPGTRMPTVFSDGRSSLATILAGDADAQAEAMWAYLLQAAR